MAESVRKNLAFGLRALAQAKVIQLMWTGISHFDGINYTISKRDVDAHNMSPLDTHKIAFDQVSEEKNINFPLHAYLHQKTSKEVCILIHNKNASWLATQNWIQDALPAWDCNCAMFARSGEVTKIKVPYIFDSLDIVNNIEKYNTTLNSETKIAILPNRAVAVFGNSINHAVMRSIYFNFAIDTMKDVIATGRENACEAEPQELLDQNFVWDNNPLFSNANHEMKILKKSMNLPLWWDRVDLTEFSDDNLDELSLLAAVDMPADTKIAKVGGKIVTKPTKYTIRLAPKVHLNMTDGGGSDDSIFTRLNHSFNPNLLAKPNPEEECITFKTLRTIKAGEQLTFDYTTTEDSTFAEPFVDLETGVAVGRS
jgi:hypothetical protein